jgi:hypothetical protein
MTLSPVVHEVSAANASAQVFAISAIPVSEHLQLTYNRERLRVKYLIGTNAFAVLQHHCPRI